MWSCHSLHTNAIRIEALTMVSPRTQERGDIEFTRVAILILYTGVVVVRPYVTECDPIKEIIISFALASEY